MILELPALPEWGWKSDKKNDLIFSDNFVEIILINI